MAERCLTRSSGMPCSCKHVRLISNVGRTDAHRFYGRKGMELVAYYFNLELK